MVADTIQHVIMNSPGVRITVGGEATGTDPAALRAAYLNRLFETTGRLSLAGIDPRPPAIRRPA